VCDSVGEGPAWDAGADEGTWVSGAGALWAASPPLPRSAIAPLVSKAAIAIGSRSETARLIHPSYTTLDHKETRKMQNFHAVLTAVPGDPFEKSLHGSAERARRRRSR
jgi:hypothetical protein